MRALVTGAGGFVGGHLLRALLAEGHEVFAGTPEAEPHDRELSGAAWLQLDVTHAESVRAAVEEARPEVVYHLAGQASVSGSFADPLGTWDVNATGTLRLAEALPAGARLLLASSAEVYGDVPEGEQPIREDRPPRPSSPYGGSKAAAEVAALQATLAGGAQAVIARSFNHTGPGQDARFAIPGFARQLARIAAGEAEPVIRVGNLEARRDLLDVRDVVRAYRLLAERGEPGAAYNVCSGRARSIREVLDELVEISGVDARVEVDPRRVRPVDLPLLQGDPSRLGALGWAPEVPLRRTLADLLEHERRAVEAHAPSAR
jgi:GDP-4-dehydro-6-deoxy-D-mannose reductase